MIKNKILVKEQWIPWNPNNIFSGYYDKVCFLDSGAEGTFITYLDEENSKKRMKIIFKGGGLASYRYTNESYMYQIQSTCASEVSLVYTVNNSEYIKWLSKVSGTLSDAMLPDLKHFVFVSSDDYIEVLYDSGPEVIFEELP